ncbi:MAG: hypothetical protein PHC34_03955 [Candidatus Gastranaerophilales bacterium]|nr:hypothetical protein [Candidatus Gastranaerophilales bacterium]
MAVYRRKFTSNKFKTFNLRHYCRYCSALFGYNYDYFENYFKIDKSSKIDYLVSNIYIYVFPPVINWPEGINIDVPVDMIIAVRKILEHFSPLAVENINELCFAFNTESSSYGDNNIIMPVEYVLNSNLKCQFMDMFAHETAHALAYAILKDKFLLHDFKKHHNLIKSASFYDKYIFFEPENSIEKLSCYQYEDYIEFFAELASQILIHYNELIKYISILKYSASKQAYFDAVNFLLNFVDPIPQMQVKQLIRNLL